MKIIYMNFSVGTVVLLPYIFYILGIWPSLMKTLHILLCWIQNLLGTILFPHTLFTPDNYNGVVETCVLYDKY